ncbi:salt tolerance down-regulator-domain-containing protein [Phascolomyces articulosus]|uniref:Stress response protein NST1 n=1 Tax=Phascolomyces articulosus TaxID=60185 RepID=A0AAD5KBR4_9FUNG|nr:salt tolerance down-regulator-domain-containing protein [Phascolomyces articulosus]
MTRSSSASNSTTTTTNNHSPYKAIMTSVPKSKRRKKPLTTAMLKRNISTVTTATTNATTNMANESDNEKNHNNNNSNHHNHNNHVDAHVNALSDSVVVKTTTTTTTTEVMNDYPINASNMNNSNNNSSTSTSTSKKKKKKNKNKGKAHDEFWSNTSNTEERQKIREFWLQLREDERRSLVKVEKEAVLRKMKEQQRHSCNCSVCGKKRTAIEDELEVLYDAYYEELEQYANNQQHSRNNPLAGSYPPSETMYEDDYLDTNGHFCQDDDEDDDEDEDYDDEDEDEDEMYDDEDDDDDDDDVSQSDRSDIPSDDDDVQYNGHMTRTASFNNSIDHLNFGNSLTVKGGILTVADDLLKNDGKKFLDMMERLAERRIKKEEVNLETEDYYDEEEDEYDEEEEDDEDVIFFLVIFSPTLNTHTMTMTMAINHPNQKKYTLVFTRYSNRRTTYGRRSSYVSNICCSYV